MTQENEASLKRQLENILRSSKVAPSSASVSFCPFPRCYALLVEFVESVPIGVRTPDWWGGLCGKEVHCDGVPDPLAGNARIVSVGTEGGSISLGGQAGGGARAARGPARRGGAAATQV